jgi:outer membrane protein assembly factor BamB
VIWLLLLGLAWAGDEPRLQAFKTIDGQSETPRVSRRFAGAFEAAPVMQWRRRLPGRRVNAASHAERSRPVILEDRIYLGAAGSTALYVLDRRSGGVRQTFEVSGAVEAEPIVTSDRIWIADNSGAVTCVRPDGSSLWRHTSGAPIPNRPARADESLYIRNVDDLVYALDEHTGEQRWQYRRKPPASRPSELTLYAAPAPVVAGSVVIVGFSDGAIVAIDRTTGDPMWELQVGEGQYPDIVAPVTAHDGLVYASGYTGPLLAIDASDATVRWRFEAGSASRAIVIDGEGGSAQLIHPGTDGVLRAFDPVDGSVVWSWKSGRGGALTEPTPTTAGLVVGSALGVLALVEPGTGETIWRWREPYVLQGVSVAPAIDGRQMVFVSNSGRVYAMVSPRSRRPAPHERRPTYPFRTAYPRGSMPSRDR